MIRSFYLVHRKMVVGHVPNRKFMSQPMFKGLEPPCHGARIVVQELRPCQKILLKDGLSIHLDFDLVSVRIAYPDGEAFAF